MRKLASLLLAGCLLAQPALAAITFDNASYRGEVLSGTFTDTYTGATLTNGLLVLCVTGAAFDSSPVATYNSVSMTKAATQLTNGGRAIYLFYLLNPASGANTISITQTGGNFLIVEAGEYAGVKQSAQPDATTTNDSGGSNVTSLATSLTIANANSWAVVCANGEGHSAWSNGTNTTFRTQDTDNHNGALYDSNAALSTGAVSLGVTATGSGVIGVAIASFQPAGAAVTIVPQLGLTGVGH